MKKLVGQREDVDTGMREALMVLSLFTLKAPPPTQIQFNQSCLQCEAPVVITLTEDINSGEIWLEGPDKCTDCDHQLSSPDAHQQMLSQEQIIGFFGKN